MHRGQLVLASGSDGCRELVLPPATAFVVRGIRWGAFERPLTPAFWAARAFVEAESGSLDRYRLGDSLREEIAACLLGGHGMPAEVAVAAFERLRDEGALKPPVNADHLFRLLSQPIEVAGRATRYRFAAQKARYLETALARFDGLVLTRDDREVRGALRTLPGVGYKTASWITRNWLQSDEVAILDVHVCRACQVMGLFPRGMSPSNCYLDLEAKFLRFAAGIGVGAARLDNLIWQTMRKLPRRFQARLRSSV